jgi:hypothetical protein
MNYDKVIEHLKNPAVKLDVLARYAQGQNPAVPEFLALAEIKRRQSLVAHSPAPAQTTVQEDLVRSATPQPMQQMPQQMAGLQAMQRPQGVAALPSGMNEQSMAGGGIVAFDDGGYVNEEMQYAGGGIVAFAGDKGSDVEDPFAGLSFEEKLRLMQAQGESGDGITTKSGLFSRGIPMVGSFNKNLSALNAPTTSAQTKTMMPADEIKGDESKLFEAERFAKEKLGNVALPTVGEKGRMAPTTKADTDSEGKTKESMYDKYEKMLTTQGAESKAARDQDKYLRLLEAGLGIMGGTSPYALTNIGQGAMGAAKGYAQDKAGYRKEDRDNIKELMALGMKREDAEREAEKMAMTKKLYESHGRYYDAAAGAQGIKAAGASTAANTRMTIAQQNLVHKYFQDLKKDMSNYGVGDDILMQKAMGMAGVQSGGGAAAPIAVGTWSPKGGLSLTGS